MAHRSRMDRWRSARWYRDSGNLIRRAIELRESRAADWIHVIASVLSNVVVLWCALLGAAVGFSTVHAGPRVERVLDRIVDVLFILSVTWPAARFAGTAVSLYGRRHLDRQVLSASLFSTIAQGIVITGPADGPRLARHRNHAATERCAASRSLRRTTDPERTRRNPSKLALALKSQRRRREDQLRKQEA
ncbi:MAG: hypothetical protein ACXVAK_16735, partial [Vulcanimicrobiaceae bacterium]